MWIFRNWSSSIIILRRGMIGNRRKKVHDTSSLDWPFPFVPSHGSLWDFGEGNKGWVRCRQNLFRREGVSHGNPLPIGIGRWILFPFRGFFPQLVDPISPIVEHSLLDGRGRLTNRNLLCWRFSPVKVHLEGTEAIISRNNCSKFWTNP